MALDSNNTITLLLQAVQEELYGKLILQIKKDFQLANVPLKVNPTFSAESISSIVKEKLYVLIMEHFDLYLNLLYIIDVSESMVKKIQASDPVEVAERVSYLIIKREFEKVSLKRKYGGKF